MASIVASPGEWTTTYAGPGDPADLFHNVGVDRDPEGSPWAGTYTVSHFFYGVVGQAAARDGRSVPIPGVARWAVEFAGTRADAERIWRNRGPISEAVAAHGGAARLRVEFAGDRLRLTEYDWGRWTDEVAALP